MLVTNTAMVDSGGGRRTGLGALCGGLGALSGWTRVESCDGQTDEDESCAAHCTIRLRGAARRQVVLVGRMSQRRGNRRLQPTADGGIPCTGVHFQVTPRSIIAVMPLKPGDRLGPYEIERLVGAGGFGSVYRALDPRLSRPVAIKVLADEITADAVGLGRFRAGSSCRSLAQSPTYLRRARSRARSRPRLHRHGTGRRPPALRARSSWGAAGLVGDPIWSADCRRPEPRACARSRAPGPQATKRDGDSELARRRLSTSDWRGGFGRLTGDGHADGGGQPTPRRERPHIWRPRHSAGSEPTNAATFGRSESCCTRWSPARCHLTAGRWPKSPRQFCATRLARCRRRFRKDLAGDYPALSRQGAGRTISGSGRGAQRARDGCHGSAGASAGCRDAAPPRSRRGIARRGRSSRRVVAGVAGYWFCRRDDSGGARRPWLCSRVARSRSGTASSSSRSGLRTRSALRSRIRRGFEFGRRQRYWLRSGRRPIRATLVVR